MMHKSNSHVELRNCPAIDEIVSNYSASPLCSPAKEWNLDRSRSDASLRMDSLVQGMKSLGYNYEEESLTNSSNYSSPQKKTELKTQSHVFSSPHFRDSGRASSNSFSSSPNNTTPTSPYVKRSLGSKFMKQPSYTNADTPYGTSTMCEYMRGTTQNDLVTAAAWGEVRANRQLYQHILQHNQKVQSSPELVTQSGYPPYCGMFGSGVQPTSISDEPYVAAKLQRFLRISQEVGPIGGDKSVFRWKGELPRRVDNKQVVYSCKLFVGGVPWDITENCLMKAFSVFGRCTIEWPGTDNKITSKMSSRSKSSGYVYIVYEDQISVHKLISQCSLGEWGKPGDLYFKMACKRLRSREIRHVQIIPWVPAQSKMSTRAGVHHDTKRTVFIGALHGMVTAEGLAKVFNEGFGGVIHAGIDTDRHQYPIGSARVVFDNDHSYLSAVRSAFVEMQTNDFKKKIQIDPFLEDSACDVCQNTYGPYFCRDLDTCFKYFCRDCWKKQHCSRQLSHHKPLMRNSRRNVNLSVSECFQAMTSSVVYPRR